MELHVSTTSVNPSLISSLALLLLPPLLSLPPPPPPPQTLYVSEHLMLCDCPGLVFPTFVTSKAEMICSGILSIDQMRDHTPPVSLVS